MLTYEEWYELYGTKLADGEWSTADEMRADFTRLHNLNLDNEIDLINKQEYEYFKQRTGESNVNI